MLSKSKGQILRVAAVLHVLFQIHMPNDNEDYSEAHDSADIIADAALCAAVDFVETSTQHAAYIAGKDAILTELEKAQSEGLLSYAIVVLYNIREYCILLCINYMLVIISSVITKVQAILIFSYI